MGERNQLTMSEEIDLYYKVVVNESCPTCGPKSWAIVGPDGAELGITFGLKEDAEELSVMLDTAYEMGLLHGKKGTN
jgi:hypothetical protein